MKTKKLICALLILVIAMIGVTAVACNKNKQKEEGPETGVYFCDAADGEYTLSLFGGDKFTFLIKGDHKSGTYEVKENDLTLTIKDEGKIDAKLSGDRITLTYNGTTVEFRRMATVNVMFNKQNGTATETQTLLIGRLLSKPEDPTYEGHIFLGWYKDAEYKTPFAFNVEHVESDMTLYAKWTDTVPTDAEYTIEFNYGEGYGGAKMSAKDTIGGKLYNVDIPQWEGHTFNGWWISTSREANKLTYKYEEGTTVFTESTTLYANWVEELDLEIKGNNITWTAGLGETSTVTITAPNGTVSTPAVTGDSLTYDFASMAAGEYKVEVSVHAGNTTTSATRYLNNKALDRVSLFSVIGTDLVFNKIANAEKYVITVECGDERHVHIAVDNGSSTTYNFTTCPQKEGGIVFTVEAQAEGYLSSSRQYKVVRELSKIDESSIKFDETTGLVSWADVKFATNYVVSIGSGNNTEIVNLGNKTSFDFRKYAGEITFGVYPEANGYYTPGYTTVKYTRSKLATPSNVKVAGNKVTWDEVATATGYEVYVDGQKIDATTTSADLTTLVSQWEVASDHTVYVVAKGSNDSLPSETLLVRYNEMYGTLKYNNSTVSWRHVANAAYYEIYVNDIPVEVEVDKDETEIVRYEGVNSAEVALNQAGYNTITVRCYFDEDGGYYEEASINVLAHTVSLYDTTGAMVGVQYLAKGDKIALPETSRLGYDFAGWYTNPLGAKGNGARYTDKTFSGNDISLYADFKSKMFTITYVYGDESMDGYVETSEVPYNEDYTLIVPQPKDSMFVFGGWYSWTYGGGRHYTDENGNSIAPWAYLEDAIVYANWIRIFNFNETGNGYAVTSMSAIAQVNEVTIPAVYNGKQVIALDANAFVNRNNITVLNIPDTITSIGSGALSGLAGLKEINVYHPENGGSENPVYYSEDGVLFHSADREIALELYPMGKTDRSYSIPEGVTEIGLRAFDGAKINKVNVPGSVTVISQRAFANCANLSSVIFKKGSDDLVIENWAFENCTSLTSITLPARLTSVAFGFEGAGTSSVQNNAAFVGCKNLSTINVEAGNAIYGAVDGGKFLGTKSGNAVTTIIYCPEANANGVVEIPRGVSTIGAAAFYNTDSSSTYEGITEVTFSETVAYVEAYAFASCYHLTTVNFNSQLEEIGSHAFANSGLSSLTIPGNVKVIGDYAFYNCNSLTGFTIESTAGVTKEIGDSAFRACLYLEEISIPDCVTKIGDYAFYGCYQNYWDRWTYQYIQSGMTKATIAASVTSIGDYAFGNDGYLETVEFAIGSKLTSIGAYAFADCSALKDLAVPTGVSTIDGGAFRGVGSFSLDGNNNFRSENGFLLSSDGKEALAFSGGVEEVVVPEGVEVLVDGLFASNNTLTKITLPSTLKIISAHAFTEMHHLEEITIPAGVTEIGQAAFENCGTWYDSSDYTNKGGLKTVTFEKGSKLTKLGDFAFQGCTALESINLPEGITAIGEQTFYRCSLLADISLPSSVTYFGPWAFRGCSALKSFNIPSALTTIESYTFAECRSIETFNIPADSKIETIGTGAFSQCSKIKEITIPASVQVISMSAFYYCNSLETVTFAEGSKLMSIEGSVFNSCSALKGIDIPDGVTSIGNSVFNFCTSLAKVSLPNSLTSIGDSTFYQCYALESIDNLGKITNIPLNLFYQCKSLESITLPDTLTEIGNYAFYGCAALESITLPDSLTSIGNYAFASFISKWFDPMITGLKEITIPGGVATIGNYAFSECYNLKKVTLEPGVTYIGEYAFYKCEAMEEISLPYTLTTLYDYAFSGCKSLKALTLSSGVSSIGIGVFSDCPANITLAKESYYTIENNIMYGQFMESIIATVGEVTGEVVIPNTVKSINASTFAYQTKMTKITWPSSLTTIPDYTFQGCTSLEEVVLPNTLKHIGVSAFEGCTALKAIELPGSLRTVVNMNKARDITYAIGYNAFAGCSNLASVKFGTEGIPTSNKEYVSFGASVFENCTSLTSFQFPDYVGAFEYMDEVYQYPNGYVSMIVVGDPIGAAFFRGCTLLSDVNLPNGIVTVNGVFRNCSSLTKIEIPSTVRTLSGGAFAGTALTELVIPAYVETIYNSDPQTGAYLGIVEGCTALKNVKVLGGLENGSNYATCMFKDCTALEEVTLSSTPNMMQGTFYNCTSLKKINYIGSMAQWAGMEKKEAFVWENGQSYNYDWNYGIPEDCVVVCSDGTVNLYGN
ncbi:MAG: leucine-rich repeat protein [Clostridiales bacterium]|nr:leucine-rich repeat protein [Clostridiales bacterium]